MDSSITNQLTKLYDLQKIDTHLDCLIELRGNLPHEVEQLNQEIQLLVTTIEQQKAFMVQLDKDIAEKKVEIRHLEEKIQKYESQQLEVTNEQEYDAITQELEYHVLEKQLAEKFVRTSYHKIEQEQMGIRQNEQLYQTKNDDLLSKRKALDDILQDTQSEESDLQERRQVLVTELEPSFYESYERIRLNTSNNLAVVSLIKGACGGCCIVVPSYQRLLAYERNELVHCDYCGRMIILPEGAISDFDAVMNLERVG